MTIKLILFKLVAAFSLQLARGDAALLSNGPVGEGRSKVHVVYLRTGTIDVAAAHDRLPLPTPTARRNLLQQQGGAAVSSPPMKSLQWGPLARTQLWLLTLGPSLHWQEDGQHLHTHSRNSVHSNLVNGRPSSTSVALGASASLDSSPQDFGKAQTRLLAALNAVGCALVSFLPPAAWLLAVADDADLTPILEGFPDVRLAPYGPSNLRVSPELAATLDLLSQAGDAVAERIAAGERLDELMDEARKEKSGWLLGAMRKHMPTRSSMKAESDRSAGGSKAQTSKVRRGPADRESAAARGGTQPGRVQLEVHFPYLEPSDLAILSSAGQKSDLDVLASESSSGISAGGDDGGDGAGAGASSYHPAAAAAADWSAALAALSPPDCPPILEPDFGSHEVLLLSLCPLALKETVEWLASAPQVSWLAPRIATRMHDNLVAGAIVQTGGVLAAARNASSLSAHPFWAVGLNGSNQIVGCGDSGLDFGQCFFYDQSVDVSANIQIDSNGMQFFDNANHRKLRYYLALVQDMVDSFGHGTHVSGTLVGSRFDRPDATAEPLATGTGQAPGAKIAFMDLSRYNADGVWTPGDLYRSYFNMTYRVGARVHSDSWGSEMTAYDTMSVSLDRFTFNNQDFVSVFAAGNYGDRSASSSRGTVTSPAVAKNCIAVGATLTTSPVAGRAPAWVPMVNMTMVVSLTGGQRFTRSVRVVKASFGISMDQAGLSNAVLVVASPESACTTLANAGAVSGRVVLVQRGGCYFTDKARYALAAGARAIIVYNDVKDSGYFSMSPPSDNSATGLGAISAGSVPLSTGLWIKAAVAAGLVTVQISNVVQPTDYTYSEYIAAYSSVGPTTDGRIKPDIVAPGALLSANSSRTVPVFRAPSCDNSIALIQMSGTSMATPVVAGSALLVRQYFLDGFYPDGVRNSNRSFPPSGPLIKAVLLGGAAHMMGVVEDTGMPLEDAPSYRQGFGRLSLLHALPLANNPSSPGWRLQVVDGVRDGALLSVNEQHQFCVTASGGPLRITLVWYDFPGEQAAARALVNNLDLEVRAAGRGMLLDYGNGVQDNVNTVEQVWYDDLAAGDVAINVKAVTIFQRAMHQPYALVVQGKFTGTLRAPGNGSSNTCATQLAVILEDVSPPLSTKNTNLTFYYTTEDGNADQVMFECRLIQQGSNTTGDWSNCSFPSRTYVNVRDGPYTFQVRVAGEQVAASRSVLVDSAPPVITLSSSLPNDITASDNVTFDFSATDASTVTFRCHVDYRNGPQNRTTVPYLRFGARTAAAPDNSSLNSSTVGKQVPIGEFFTCHSPLEFVGMAYGNYVLLVSAVDVTENGADKELSWRIRFSPNATYARMVSGPLGLVADRSLQYGVVGFLGSQAASTPPEQMSLRGYKYEYITVPQLSGNSTLRDIANAASWQPMQIDNNVSHANLQVNLTSDGSYLVLVRYQGSADPITWAMASVQVDTTAPVVVITRAPNSYQSDPVVTLRFADNGTDDDTRMFFCRWMGNNNTRPDPDTPETSEPYLPCRDSVTFNVTEGFWLFQVKGQDLAGNIGLPANASFVTDLEPPVITYTLPSMVNYSRLEWNYTISDTGSEMYNGSTNSSCAFRWVQLENASVRVNGDDDYPAATQIFPWRSPCPPPPFRFTLQEGRYLWSVAANDQAGLRVARDVTVLADFSKPHSLVFIGNRRLPSKFSVTLVSVDLPNTINSGVIRQECMIDTASAPPPASPPSPPLSQLPPSPSPSSSSSSSPSPRPPSPTALNGRVAAANPPTLGLGSSNDGGSSGSARRSLQQQGGGGAGPRLYRPGGNGTMIQMGVWHVCSEGGAASNVTYEGFSTGYYVFSLRAKDAAGNQGNATAPKFFTVDASLPADGSDSVQVNRSNKDGPSGRTTKIVIVVAVIVAALVLVAVIIVIFVARRRRLRKYESRAAQMPPGLAAAVASSGGIAMQPIHGGPPPPLSPSAVPYSNGTTMGYSNGSHAPPSSVAPSVIAGVPLAALPVGTPAAGPYYPAQLPVGGAAVVAGVPYPADPVLATALAVSAEEAQRARAVEEAERARVAALAMEDEQRLRRAIAASIEEENLRRAKEASLQAAVQQSSEQAALDAAIAASLATAEQDLQRQQQRAAQQQQPPRPPQPVVPQPPPTAPPAGPPDYGLI